ncbi:MAG TPA: hypothetical protein VHD36_17170 [Pirellulales bacterium]|nr:hypothetical protein [Pirellulales bacterium]
MELILPGVFALIVIITIASLGNEGMWSNAIVLFNVVTAALLATNFWEPLVRKCLSSQPNGVYVFDFPVIWLLFAGFYLSLRIVTDSISRVRVRFPAMVDKIGSFFFAGWVGWVLVCFIAMTLHMAPLSKNFLFGGFKPEERMFFGLAPDRQWLGFMQKMSLGTFSRSAPADNPDAHVFDPEGQFMVKYAARRTIMQKGVQVWVSKRK